MVEDFKESGKWATSKRVDGKKHLTCSYIVWNGIQNRCKAGGVFQRRFPSYVGCTMSAEFSDFQTFTDWHVSQVGYGVEGYAIDKDILDKGLKLYSSHTCVLVPRELNSFYTPHTKPRSLPQGVYQVGKKFKACLSVGNKLVYLGHFATVADAKQAHNTAKIAEAIRWADRLEAGEYLVDSRIISALRNFKVEELCAK